MGLSIPSDCLQKCKKLYCRSRTSCNLNKGRSDLRKTASCPENIKAVREALDDPKTRHAQRIYYMHSPNRFGYTICNIQSNYSTGFMCVFLSDDQTASASINGLTLVAILNENQRFFEKVTISDEQYLL